MKTAIPGKLFKGLYVVYSIYILINLFILFKKIKNSELIVC